MRRVLCTLMSIVMIVFLVACQPTPDKPVVIQKDADRLLSSARDGTGEKALREEYGIPEHYQFDLQQPDENFNIVVDAPVIVPDIVRMPIYRVRLREFSEEEAYSFYEEYCNGLDMVLFMDSPTQDLIDDIEGYKRRIAELEVNPELADWPEELEQAVKELIKLEVQLEKAPPIVIESFDGKFRVLYSEPWRDIDDVVLGYIAYERVKRRNGKTLVVRNHRIFNTNGLLYRDSADPCNINIFWSSTIAISDDTEVDAQTLSMVGFKPSEAKALAQQMLDKNQISMAADSIQLVKSLSDEDGVKQTICYYRVNCVREVDGFRCSDIFARSNPSDDIYAQTWDYEMIYSYVSSDGIWYFVWSNPLEVIDMVSEDTQLLPFSQIQQTFENMMPIQYAPQAISRKLHIEIDRVTLSLHRIVERDSIESGLLIPAWNFYGRHTDYDWEDNSEIWSHTQSLMTINAIDGSVIDNEKGY